jgi:hypothetical protein
MSRISRYITTYILVDDSVNRKKLHLYAPRTHLIFIHSLFILQVGSKDASMSGKEELVLKGLDAARKSIDEFLAYFPAAEVEAARSRVKEENALNVKEFDTSVGAILNLDPNLL